MIKIDEEDPVGEIAPSFPYRDVKVRRGVDVKEFYDLQAEIGRGKFGTVYKCREKSTGLQLAAKFVSTSRKDDKRNVEREIDIMRELQHPRLIQLYDAFEKDKVTVVILELIEGGELFERVIDDDFVLTEKSCTVFMRQICEGMEFIHKQNILHLDMKPENILCLTRTGNRIKIIDFGLARKFDPDKKLQVLFGTPEFVAPEVVNFDRIGFETDMWSIGVICYVLLSGLSPFMGETDIETMANVTIAKWDFDDEAFLEISDDAKDFISKLLVKDREARMSATQSLAHPWLRRKPPKKQPPAVAAIIKSELDLTKDNLRGFVERWSEHPTSPYIFDTSCHTISPCVSVTCIPRSRPPSLCANSPSPCGSLASLSDADTPPRSPLLPPKVPRPVNNNSPLLSPKNNMDRLSNFDRRASDSSCFLRHNNDFVGRINLAEEIKKLSDKLVMFNSVTNDSINNNETAMTSNSSFFSSSVKTSTKTFDSSRRKFKVSNLDRDEHKTTSPCWSHLSSDTASSSSSQSLPPSPRQSPEPPELAHDLLQLLDKLEGFGKRGESHRPSLSVDWSDSDTLGQRTMRSLSQYISSSRGSQVQKRKSQFAPP